MYKEEQYDFLGSIKSEKGTTVLGSMANGTWHLDPKRLAFTLARYKFVSKMLDGRKSVLEIGAGDGWASRIVARSVVNLTVTDFDPEFTKECQDLGKSEPNVKFRTWNPLTSPWSMKEFDSCYLLDVLEHIDSSDEDLFMKRIISALTPEAVIVVGMPSIESQPFASKASKLGHVNCKTSEELKTFLEKYFVNVFSFGMNDEVLHTGFARFRQYLFCIGSVPRK